MRSSSLFIALLAFTLGCGASNSTEARPVARVRLAAPEWLFLGVSARLVATVLAHDGSALSDRIVTWASGDSALAYVSNDGMIRARAVGSVRIFVSSEGKADSADLNILAPKVDNSRYVLQTVDGGHAPFLLVDTQSPDGTRRRQWLLADTIRFFPDGQIQYANVRRFSETSPEGEEVIDDVISRGGGYFEQIDDRLGIAWNLQSVPRKSDYTDTLRLRVDGLARWVKRPPPCLTCPVGPIAEYVYQK